MPRFFGLLTRTPDAEWRCEFPDVAGVTVLAGTIAQLRVRARAELERAFAERRLRREPEITASPAEKIARQPGAPRALLFAIDVNGVAPCRPAARTEDSRHRP